jgi:hypothetical protein
VLRVSSSCNPLLAAICARSYFFDRPDDEVPENALHTRQAAVKSFAGHLPAGRQSRGQSLMQVA